MYQPKPVAALSSFYRLSRRGHLPPAFNVRYRSHTGTVELRDGYILYLAGSKLAQRIEHPDTSADCQATIAARVRLSLGMGADTQLTFKGL